MSSNQQIKKICQHCNEMFVAQKATTKFCSLKCAQRNYKLREKKDRIRKSNEDNVKVIQAEQAIKQDSQAVSPEQQTGELISIKTLASLTSLSERTLFRLIKDEAFPKLKVKRSLLFHKEMALNYLISKYGNL